MSPKQFELTADADKDLEDIFDYTKFKFGTNQAKIYLSKLLEIFIKLSINPELGRLRNEMKEGMRSFSTGSHVIFYRIVGEKVRILRVVHGNRDLPSFFMEH